MGKFDVECVVRRQTMMATNRLDWPGDLFQRDTVESRTQYPKGIEKGFGLFRLDASSALAQEESIQNLN